jgi:hypothetical protein
MRPSDKDPVDRLIDDLDLLYQNVLDRLESQTRDALIIDQAIRRLLDQSDSEEAVLNWQPERAMSPKTAFRALALRLIPHAEALATRPVGVSRLDYEDMLVWPDEPVRRGVSLADDFVDRIRYARTKTIREFWDRLHGRISPEGNPALSLDTAATDLLRAFATPHPEMVSISTARLGDRQGLLLPLSKAHNDVDLVLSVSGLQNITRANHAISTLCALEGRPEIGTSVYELTGNLHQRLTSSFRQYRPGETYYADDYLRVRMDRGHILYAMDRQLFELVRSTLPRFAENLQFVQAPSLR